MKSRIPMLVIQKKSYAQKAADVLRKGILNGSFQPGGRLGEQWLADHLNLSRGTIRSALQELTFEGLVRAIPYSGWEVVSFSVKDAEELCEIRVGLEAMAAKLAAKNIDSEGAKRLSEDSERLMIAAQNQNHAECNDRDLKLHLTICDLTQNSRLIEIYRSIEQQIRVCVAFNNLRSEYDEIAHWHDTLVRAILDGDAEAAERSARDNAERSGAELIAQLKRNLREQDRGNSFEEGEDRSLLRSAKN